MKKSLKRIAMGFMVLFMIIGMTATGFAVSGRIEWAGTDSVNNSIEYIYSFSELMKEKNDEIEFVKDKLGDDYIATDGLKTSVSKFVEKHNKTLKELESAKEKLKSSNDGALKDVRILEKLLKALSEGEDLPENSNQ